MGSKKLNIEGCMNMETLKKDNAHEMKNEWYVKTFVILMDQKF
jgi:hypothetical protein